ncbi:MAG: hypothetical protein KKI09_09845 [Spirochaetes bacterium]|nr:hypothetical protein [Spirochaetota bacterium]MBU0955717.1 hypothetical protein [Spirochaetota bacterium]
MATETKVYDYNKDKVRSALLQAFRKHKGEAGVADLVAFTGLPKHQVETELPAVADEYRGRLKVTESGQILYSFPQGYASRYRGWRPALKKLWRGFSKGLAKVLAFLFKIWIMVMLVGYFVLFMALVVLALVASVAGSMADSKGSSRRSGGGLGGLALTTRLIDLFVRIWFYNEIFNGGSQRRYAQRSVARGAVRDRKNRRPLHRAIFSFVFGESDPNAGHDQVTRRVFVSMVQAKKGIILLEDFMALTGLSASEADLAISRYLYEFEGSPEVSENGTVYYHFPSLLARTRDSDLGTGDLPYRRLRPFSANDKKANAIYALINGVNLLFGGFFLGSWLSYGPVILLARSKPVATLRYFYGFVYTLFETYIGNAAFIVPWILGAVPIAFSVVFWLVPALRSLKVKAENESIKRENLRRALYARVLDNPARVAPVQPELLPVLARPADSRLPVKLLDELAAVEQGDPQADGSWNFPELARKVADADQLRAKVRLSDYSVGKTVFDTGE